MCDNIPTNNSNKSDFERSVNNTEWPPKKWVAKEQMTKEQAEKILDCVFTPLEEPNNEKVQTNN